LYCNVLFKRWVRSCLKESKRTCLVLVSARAFYTSRPDNYNETQCPTGGLGLGKTLCSRTLMARSSKRCLQRYGCHRVLSSRLTTSHACTVWHRVVGPPGTIAIHREWATGWRYTVAACCEWPGDRRCPVAVLQTPYPHVLLAFIVSPVACLTCA
jgi:hypothetical protein